MGTVRLLQIVIVSIFLFGCGQKGPLILPDTPHPHKRIGIDKPPLAPVGGTEPSVTRPAPAATPNSFVSPQN